MKQTTTYKAAVIIHTLNSLYGIIFAFPAMMQGPSAPGITDGVPQVVIVLSALLGVAGLVSAYGAWQGQKWGIWLTIFIEAVNGLLALPGVLFAPNQAARMSAIVGVMISLFVIFALLRRPKPVIAPPAE